MTTVTPYLCVHDAAGALDFYGRAFGARETSRWTDPDTGIIGHAEFDVDDARFYVSDEWHDGGVYSPRTIGGTPVSFVLEVDDVDGAFIRAVDAGAEVERPVADSAHGRGGWLIDPFGHRWHLTARAPDMSADELQREVGDTYVIT